jgi:glycosyltransferase 2 family protein
MGVDGLDTERAAGDTGRGVRRPRFPLGLVVSAVALAAVVWWARRQEAPTFPTAPGDVALVLGAVPVYLLITVVRGWRWHAILRRAGVEHRAADAIALTAVGYMGNTILPARGGELLRILLMAERSSARRREVLGSLIAERLLDIATLVLLFTAITWFGVAGAARERELAAWAFTAGVAICLLLAAYLLLRRRGRLEGFAARIRPVALASRLLIGRNGFELALLTLVIWALEAVVLWLVVEGVGLPVSYLQAVFVVVLTSFAAAVPAGPGYLGTLDAAILFALDTLGVRGGQAISVVVLWRFVLFVPITVVGLVILVARYGGLARLRRAATDPSG